jgi:hypothetical protein
MNVDIPIRQELFLRRLRNPKFVRVRFHPAKPDLGAFANDFAQFTGQLKAPFARHALQSQYHVTSAPA